MPKLRNALLAGACVLALGAGAAQAATVTHAFTNPAAPTELNQTGTLSLFDPTLGTLTGVTLTLTGGVDTRLELSTLGPVDRNGTASSSIFLFFSTSLPGVLPPDFTPDVTVTFNFGTVTIPGGGRPALVIDPPLRTESITLTGLPLAGFTGPGSFTVACETMSGLSISGGGGQVRSNQTTTGFCGAAVTYTYTAGGGGGAAVVPTPTSFALLGAGLLGLGLTRLRSRAA